MPGQHDETQREFALAVANMVELVTPLREAALGYRAQLIAQGIHADAADMMAADFHRMVTSSVVSNLTAPARTV